MGDIPEKVRTKSEPRTPNARREPDLIEVHTRIGNDYQLWRHTAQTLFAAATILSREYERPYDAPVADDFQWRCIQSGQRQCFLRLVSSV